MYKKDILNILQQNKCFMAHCFTMDSKYGSLYDRLKYTINNKTNNELCTSTIKIGDIAFENYFGGIGIIVEPDNVLFSSRCDGGTNRLPNGELIYNDEIGTENPTLKQFENDILNRKKYNEFRVPSYDVTGIFISQDKKGWPIAKQIINNDFKEFYDQTETYDLKYYFLSKGILKELFFNEKTKFFEDK